MKHDIFPEVESQYLAATKISEILNKEPVAELASNKTRCR